MSNNVRLEATKLLLERQAEETFQVIDGVTSRDIEVLRQKWIKLQLAEYKKQEKQREEQSKLLNKILQMYPNLTLQNVEQLGRVDQSEKEKAYALDGLISQVGVVEGELRFPRNLAQQIYNLKRRFQS